MNVKPGDKIVFLTTPGSTVKYPDFQGIAYGHTNGDLKVKCTDDRGNVTFNYVRNFVQSGSGAYYIGR